MSLVLLSLAALCQGALPQEPVSSRSRPFPHLHPSSWDLEVGRPASLSLVKAFVEGFLERASLHPWGTQTCPGQAARGFLLLGQTTEAQMPPFTLISVIYDH